MAATTPQSSSTGKSTAKKSPTKKSPAKRAPRKSSKEASSSQDGNGSDSGRRRAPSAEARPTPRASQVAAQAAQDLVELTGRGVEGITGLERTDDGWTVQVEVVEVRRIPDTTDVLALYEVKTDRQGSMLGYRRIRRYARGVPGED